MTLPEALGEARKRLKLSQQAMAERCGVTQAAISSWEAKDGAAARSMPSRGKLPAVAAGYELPLETVQQLWFSAGEPAREESPAEPSAEVSK